MRIQLTNVVLGVGAGILDDVLENDDAAKGRTEPLKGWADWARIGLAGVGYLGQMFNFFPAVSQPLAQSEVTLVTKSVAKYVRSRTGVASASPTRREVAAPAPGRRVGWRPQPIGI